jgi:hypothetical protein
MRRTYFGWIVSLGLAASAFLFGACFHIGDQTGTCATGTTCTCDGIGNCEEHCPGGNCHFSCTGIGNCNVTCEGGGCDLACSGTGNCNLDCSGGNCTSNCLGHTNCICRNCNEFDGGVIQDGGADSGAADAGPCGGLGERCCNELTECGIGAHCSIEGPHPEAGVCIADDIDGGSDADVDAAGDVGVDAP